MARDLNQVIIIGRLVRPPEIRYTASGLPVTKFSIANNEVYTQANERKEFVNYFDVVVWGNQAVNCEKFLNKGSQVAIDGRLRQNRWDDPNGQKRSKVEIIANSVQFLTPAGGGNRDNYVPQENSTVPPNNGPRVPFNQKPNNNNNNNNNQKPVNKTSNSTDSNFIADPWGETNNADPSYDDYQDYGNEDDIPF